MSARTACGRQAAGEPGAVLAAWDQAMESMAAAALTSTARGLTATTMQVDRRLDAGGRRVREQQASVRTDYVTAPWKALPADSLRRRGYVWIDDGDSTTYNAHGLDVLLSPQFLEDHCLRLAAGRDTSELGIVFEPVPDLRLRSEIRGTLRLTRATAALQRMDFSFTNVPVPSGASATAGGTMTFARLRDGAVVITGWDVRMPIFVKDSPRSPSVRATELSTTDGQLVMARRGRDTLYRAQTDLVTGTVRDSVSGTPVRAAIVGLAGTSGTPATDAEGRLRLKGVLRGEYALLVRTPSLDSIRSVPDHPARGRPAGGRDNQGAHWRATAVSPDGSLQRTARRLETRTSATGAFRLCGVPTKAPLTVRALPASDRSNPVSARLAADDRFALVTLAIDVARPASAPFAGKVVADSTLRPLSDVEVTVSALDLSTRTDARGQFRLGGIPAGTHDAVVRRVGYGVMNTALP